MITLVSDKTKSHLKLSEYQERASQSNQFKDNPEAKDQLRYGFFGEIGSVLSLVKKSIRDLQHADHMGIKEELGDALWYLTTIAIEYGLTLQQVGLEALIELKNRLNFQSGEATAELTFEKFDGLMAYHKDSLSPEIIPDTLKKLGAHAGRLLSEEFNKDLADFASIKLLSELLADMVTVGALFNQNFVDIAEHNLYKFESRWIPEGVDYIPLFDEDFPEMEKFPRELSMHFIESTIGSNVPYVIQRMNGVNIGDRLNDNRTIGDGYRFHDVFHLSYLVHLGWSPVIRALLKIKRKSKPEIDENEDGARAIIIEEGIATWIFNHASKRGFFQTITKGRLDYGMLKQVVDMVDGYEVSKCPSWQWEVAILDGFTIFRQLYEAGGGIVHVNLIDRTLTFEALPAEEIVTPPPKKRQKIIGAALPPTAS